MNNSSTVEKDVFISYASEDREVVAKPLAQLLSSLGISVWFDQFDLKIGDSLRHKIDEGLKKSRYGIAVLSPAFFDKHYTKLELDGLAQREVDGEKVILPIWVKMDAKQIRSFSPTLADRIAGRWEEGIYVVLAKLIEVIKPGIIEAWQKRITVMPRLTTGREVIDVVTSCHFSYSFNDEPNNDAEIDLVGGFLQELRDWCDIWDDIDIPGQMKATSRVSDMVGELETSGWTIYGSKMKGRRKLAGVESEWKWYAIAVIRGQPEEVMFAGDRILVHKPEKQT
ncbi:MAG: toll/interleukin-1 receptor domain-containing protein [Candidatus Omnitrophica bacterium]|nr:toll/interleukin-1 receptor domain-containing protein [Candidatus Omnitrophota bacterium]